ncbi:MAG: ATP-binding cassette domain-containing protein [Rubripirellula sp.]
MAVTPNDDGRPIVDVQTIAKTYGGWALAGRRKITALKGVSLEANAGEVFGLLGPNGAGKTTLIKVLLGVVTPSSGKASLFGEPVGSSAARARVGYLPESLRVDRHHTARSALRYYGRLSRMPASDIARRSDELLELVGLRGRDKESVKRFSKGMNQRLGLAQALMHDPDLLVLDEPTDGLDPVGRSEVRKVIERLRDAGKTIFLNSHILHEVEMVCTRVAILAGGEIRGSGTLEELSNASQSQQLVVDVCLPKGDQASSLQSGLADQIDDCQWIETPYGRATHRLIAKLPDQDNVDKIVDQLRSNDVSIVGLETKRPTLEDTFMRLVGPAEADAS